MLVAAGIDHKQPPIPIKGRLTNDSSVFCTRHQKNQLIKYNANMYI